MQAKPLTEDTARELIKSLDALTFGIKGLTGVLLEDRQAGDTEDTHEQEAAGIRYMDA